MHTILNSKLVLSFPVLAGALWPKNFPRLAPIDLWVISRDWGLYLIFPRFSPIMWLVLSFNIAKISTRKWFRIHFNNGCNKINRVNLVVLFVLKYLQYADITELCPSSPFSNSLKACTYTLYNVPGFKPSLLVNVNLFVATPTFTEYDHWLVSLISTA